MPENLSDIYGEKKEPKDHKLYRLIEEYKAYPKQREKLVQAIETIERQNKNRSDSGYLATQDLEEYHKAKLDLKNGDRNQINRYQDIVKLCYPDGEILDWWITISMPTKNDLRFRILDEEIELS
jgi:hypothetical protein